MSTTINPPRPTSRAPVSTPPGARRLVAGALVVWLAGAGMFLAPISPYFRHWELLRQGPVAFRPLSALALRACGDLGRNACVGGLRRWRGVRFTTDAFGFRNPPGEPWARVVVIGDSYVVGSGLDDTETVPQVMSRALGEPVYNYGVTARLGPLAYLADPRSRDAAPAVVIWAPASRTVAPVPLGLDPPPASARGAGGDPMEIGLDRARAWEARVAEWKQRREETSALIAASRRLFHEVYHSATGRPWAVAQIHVEGDPALVLGLADQELCSGQAERPPQDAARCIERLAREVEARGSRFLFAPIPEAGSLYADHYPAGERRSLSVPPFLDLVFADLSRSGVAYLDLRPGLAAQRFPYLFLRDDTHLGPAGSEAVGRLLGAAVRPELEALKFPGPGADSR